MFKRGQMTKEEALSHIKTEYARLDQICHVNTTGIEISLSSRMTRQLGCFTYKRTGITEKLQIKISDRIINDPELFIDVIRHEYAHMIVYLRAPREKHMHDSVWKAACMEVGCESKATRKMKEESVSIKDFSVKQISDHLKIKKQLNSDEIDAIISKLKSYGLLDDERYCINRTNYLSKQFLSIKQIKNIKPNQKS